MNDCYEFGHQLPRTPVMSFSCSFKHGPDGERQSLETRDAVFERGHVVADLPQILGAALDGAPRLRGEQFAEGRLRALDAAGEYGLPLHERTDEKMRIRQPSASASESPEQLVGFGQRAHKPGRPNQFRRQRIRMKSSIPGKRLDPLPGGFGAVGGAAFHGETRTDAISIFISVMK